MLEIIILKSGQGAERDLHLLNLVAMEVWRTAVRRATMWNGSRSLLFVLVTKRRNGQSEFRQKGHKVAVVRTFRDHYERACKEVGVTPIHRDEFEEAQAGEVLAQIRSDQPEVFDRLEEIRHSLWNRGASCTGATTLLCMTHKASQLWYEQSHAGVASPGVRPG